MSVKFNSVSLAVIAGLCAAGMAQAQDAAAPLTGEAAGAVLYAPKVAMVEMVPEILPEDQAKVLEMVAKDQLYYAAIALSPDEGLMSEATVAAANFHDIPSATTVALENCNAKKKEGAADCVIAATVTPEGWAPEAAIQLSSDATADFQAAYAGGAMAISPVTGAWGLGADADAAIAACITRQPAATDCKVVIAD